MRRFVFVFLVSSLLLIPAFVQKRNIPAVKASSSIRQGDLILTGNNVTVIEGRFDINGSIIVEENATLFLKDAFLNFTQTDRFQYNISLRNPSNGNPRLLAYNSTITSDYRMGLYLRSNSTAIIDNSTIPHSLYAIDNSNISISSSNVLSLHADDSSVVSIYNSTIDSMDTHDSSEVQIYDSQINYLSIESTSVNCVISNLEPGLISYWSFITNCSVNILPGGSTPNTTITKTSVSNWMFTFLGDFGPSNAAILNSSISEASVSFGQLSLESTACWSVNAYSSSVLLIKDSAIINLYAYHFSNSWLLNSTYAYLYIKDSAKVHVSRYLDVHVIDSIDQDVPSANVTATYPNTTIAESKLTDANGWTRLTLMEKMMNATGDYSIGNYTVTAKYEVHTGQQSVNMTDNKEITIQLPFIIPEFPSLAILPLFMIATLLAVIVYRRKHSM